MPDERFLSGPQALRPVRDGLVIAGAPIGTDAFVHAHLSSMIPYKHGQKSLTWSRRSARWNLKWLHILGICTSNLPSYLLRAIPTPALAPFLTKFDELMAEARLAILTPPGHNPPPTQ